MFKSTLNKKSNINIIPMIDVIFFLLVFFMLFTSFRATPEGLELQLPTAETVTEQTQEHIVIDITAQGEYYLEGELMPLADIRVRVQELSAEHDNLIAIINADEETRYHHVISVMDGLRQEGFYNLALAAEREN